MTNKELQMSPAPYLDPSPELMYICQILNLNLFLNPGPIEFVNQ